jgi:hypothetical protein
MEACADALLTAAGAYFITFNNCGPTPEEARHLAIAALDVVLSRTAEEGAKPRGN